VRFSALVDMRCICFFVKITQRDKSLKSAPFTFLDFIFITVDGIQCNSQVHGMTLEIPPKNLQVDFLMNVLPTLDKLCKHRSLESLINILIFSDLCVHT
jgi:hypothetical protein